MNIRHLRWLAAFLLAICIITFLAKGITAALGMGVAGSLSLDLLNKRIMRGGYCFAYTGATLADIFIPSVYAAIQANDSPELTAFVQSGAVRKDPLLDAAAESGTKKIEVPLWNDLDATVEPNYSDDTDTKAVPGKIGVTSMDARNSYLNKGYGAADLTVEISGATPGQGNPMTRIKNRFATYWNRQFQRRVIAVAHGIFNANVVQDASDMVKDIALQTTVGQTAANLISATAVVDAVFTLGDAFGGIVMIAMHSVVYSNLVKQQLIEFVKDADGKLLYETYLGKRVVVDDSLPVIAGTTSGFRYLTILFGSGAIGYGEGTPTVPAETDRIPDGGSGGGLENIWERKTWMIHPFGFDWLENTVAAPGHSPTLANLRLAANWDRTIARKSIPLAYLVTNG